MPAKPVAHWKLTGDCRDSSGNGHHGCNRGAALAADGAHFDGRTAWIEVPDAPALHFSDADFSIAAWEHTAGLLDDNLGDILGKFDPASRKGFNFCIQNFHGVTSGQPNLRNVFFGIDDGRAPRGWEDCGRPGDSLMVWALCVYQGALYVGTFETGREQAGHVYRYDGDTSWTDCGSPHPSNAITSLAVHEGRLYAAASHYRAAGSSIAESENVVPGGRVFRYEGGTEWSDCGQLGEAEAVGGMAVYKGRLYASSMYAPAGLFRYEGGMSWFHCGHPGGRVEALALHDGHLYGSGWDQHRPGVYRFDGPGAWADCGAPPDTTQTYSFAMYQGRLHAGTWPSGRVFDYAGGRWQDCGRLGEEEEVMGLAVYNGKLYGGTLPLAEVYRYENDGAWISTGQLDTTEGVRYRRAWSMAVYDGKLFCGTLPAGRVYALQAGQAVTHDHELPPGWQHLAAVRRAGALELYVNGRRVAVSPPGKDGFDISNTESLTLGFGAHDYFNGSLKDVRIYAHALAQDELPAIMNESAP